MVFSVAKKDIPTLLVEEGDGTGQALELDLVHEAVNALQASTLDSDEHHTSS